MSYSKLAIGQEIELIEDMCGCVSEGKRTIWKGTKMKYYFSQLTWDYFKDTEGNTLIIMGGPSSSDWDCIKAN